MKEFLLITSGTIAGMGGTAIWTVLGMPGTVPIEFRAIVGLGGFVALLAGLGLWALVKK